MLLFKVSNATAKLFDTIWENSSGKKWNLPDGYYWLAMTVCLFVFFLIFGVFCFFIQQDQNAGATLD